MKVNDLVSIRVCRGHFVGFGVLTEVNLKDGTGVVMRDGQRYVRSLKRIKPTSEGRKALAKKLAK